MLLWYWPDDTEVNSYPAFPTQSKFSSCVERGLPGRFAYSQGALKRKVGFVYFFFSFLSKETEKLFSARNAAICHPENSHFELKFCHSTLGFTYGGPPRYGWGGAFKEAGKRLVILNIWNQLKSGTFLMLMETYFSVPINLLCLW